MLVIFSEREAVISSFDHFNSGLQQRNLDYEIKGTKSGLISNTCFLTCRSGGEKFVVRKLNRVFNSHAINDNLKLLDKAQKLASKDAPKYWQFVEYLNVSGGVEKVYFDTSGCGWVVMRYLPGKIKVFNNFSHVPPKDRRKLAHSFGQALKTFQNILATVRLKSWRQTLPNLHNAKYHYDYLHAVLACKKVTLSLSHDLSSKVSLQHWFLDKYSKRIEALLAQIEERQYLIPGFEKLGLGVVHGDTKVNNAIFSKDSNGEWRCVSLVDLDTIQVEPILNDLGDALRSAGSLVGERPESLDLIKIDRTVVEGIIDGYAKTESLKKYAWEAYAHFLYMLGIRFLADSLVGSQYFKLKENEPEDLNLYRAEVQFPTLAKVLIQ